MWSLEKIADCVWWKMVMQSRVLRDTLWVYGCSQSPPWETREKPGVSRWPDRSWFMMERLVGLWLKLGDWAPSLYPKHMVAWLVVWNIFVSHILGIIIPIDKYFQRGSNHQPDSFEMFFQHLMSGYEENSGDEVLICGAGSGRKWLFETL